MRISLFYQVRNNDDLKRILSRARSDGFVLLSKITPPQVADLMEIMLQEASVDGIMDLELESLSPEGPVIIWSKKLVRIDKSKRRREIVVSSLKEG